MIAVPPALEANRQLGPKWSAWLDLLPRQVEELLQEWNLRMDDRGGDPWHGSCSVVVPVRAEGGLAAVLKIGSRRRTARTSTWR